MTDDEIITEVEDDIQYRRRLIAWAKKQHNPIPLIVELATIKNADLNEFGKKMTIIRINTYIAKRLPRIIDEPIPEKRKYVLDD